MAARKTSKAAAKKPAKKAAPKKAPAKKAPAKAAKKAPAKKAPAKAAKKAPAKAAKKAPAKKAPARKAAAKAPAKGAKKTAKASASKQLTPKKAPAARAAKTAKKPAEKAPETALLAETAPAAAAPAPSPAPAPAPQAAPEAPTGPMITTADGGHHVAPPAPVEAEPEIPAGMPQPGAEAPEFSLSGDDDQPVTLSGLRGRKVVLYFYPRDNTPGCTIEAQDFTQLLPEFEAKNAIVLGVSTDSTESHRKFKNLCELGVKLLADPDKSAHQAFGTWREKNMYGKLVMGTQRSTFLIDEEGRVVKVWPKVKVENHALDVLNAIR